MLSFLTEPISIVILFLYQQLGSLGFSILLFTAVLRAVLFPFSVPLMKSQKKMQALKPHLDKLKEQFGHDKVKMQQEQMKLYKDHNVNPTAGCIPYILQFVVLIGLYSVLNELLTKHMIGSVSVNTQFFWLDLSKPDKTYILPVLAAVTQLILSIMIMPGIEKHDLVPNNSKSKKIQVLNKKEDKTQDMAEMIQKQSLFIMPVMTGFLALSFPSGLAMYWVATTVFSIIQQWVITGPGGLLTYTQKILQKFGGKV